MVGLQWCKDKEHCEVDLNNHVDEILDEHLSKVAEGKVWKLIDIYFYRWQLFDQNMNDVDLNIGICYKYLYSY